MKLIKIKEDHYIVVDDSEVRPGDYVYTSVTSKTVRFTDPRHFSDGTYWKVSHSTIAIEKYHSSSEEGGHGYFVFDKVKELSLQEVKDLIGDVDVEKKSGAQDRTF